QYENEFTGEFSSVVAGKDTVQQFYFSGVPLTTATDNVWIHLVVTWNGSTITTYMNGANAHSVAQTVTPGSNANPFSIGYNAVGNGSPNYWRGRIDEVGIWNRALTAGEDSLLYAAGYGNQYPFDGSANVLPTANAGANQTLTAGTTSTTLTGSGTGTAITYAWTKISGTGGTITTPNAATTTLTGLSAGTYSYQITGTDNLGNTASSIVNVTVNPIPTANAGPDTTLAAGSTSTTLNGSGTGTASTYAWAKVSGTGGTITAPTADTTTVTGLTSGTYAYQLTVTDNKGTTAHDTVIITVNPFPTAYAGTNQILASTATSTNLSGTASGNGVNYLWSTSSGATI